MIFLFYVVFPLADPTTQQPRAGCVTSCPQVKWALQEQSCMYVCASRCFCWCFAQTKQGTEAHVSSGFAASEAMVEASSLDSSSGRPGSAYFIGQKTSSHSRRFWLLLYCHDDLARWPYSGNLLWKCLCGQYGRAKDKLRMQWLVSGVTDAVFRQPETVSGWKVCLGHS